MGRFQTLTVFCVFCCLFLPSNTASQDSDIGAVLTLVLIKSSCHYEDDTIPHKTTINRTRYEESSVAYGESCAGEIQTGSCDNGALSWTGSYEHDSCTVEEPTDCTSDGQVVVHGSDTTRTRFEVTSVAYGESCTGETQTGTCDNGALSWSGSYEHDNCTIEEPADCTYDDQVVAHGGSTSRTRYEAPSVAYGESCGDETQTGTCDNGALSWSGSYEYDSCTAEESCTVGACKNEGTCDETSGTCVCTGGYIGATCEEYACPDAKCQPNGVCSWEDGSCDCFTGWIGDNCDEVACPPDKCLNGASCNQDTGICECVDVWTGPSCEDLHCPPGKCNDHGTCDQYTGQCTCDEGYGGNDCDTETCPINKCQPNGQCISEDGSCSCNDGYSGDNCQIDLCEVEFNRCNESNNGGTCEYIGTDGQCNCEVNWSGDSCETFTCSDDVDCLNGGTCVSGSCECVEPYSGPSCAEEDCPATRCSGNGTCNNDGSCNCDPGFDDIDCSLDICESEFYSCSSDSNQGQCALDGDNQVYCECNEGFSGTYCHIEL